MTLSEIQFYLTITEADDAESLDELTGRLLHDLRELGAESVERPTGRTASEGAKGGSFPLGRLTLLLSLLLLPLLQPPPGHAAGSGNWRTHTTADSLRSDNVQALAHREDPLGFPPCSPGGFRAGIILARIGASPSLEML